MDFQVPKNHSKLSQFSVSVCLSLGGERKEGRELDDF